MGIFTSIKVKAIKRLFFFLHKTLHKIQIKVFPICQILLLNTKIKPVIHLFNISTDSFINYQSKQ